MINWALHNALAASVLILIVLLLRRPVAEMFGPRAAYALWLAPAARAVLPPVSLPQLPMPSGPILSGPVNYAIVSGPVESSALPWVQTLLWVWLAGAAGYLAIHWLRHQLFLSNALAAGRPLQSANVPYDVVASPTIDGPLATGLIHSVILVPEDFEERFTPDQQHLALLHEQAHHQRGDIWACLAAMLLTAFLWFNPFAHMALRAFRRDMEAACDARVIAVAGAATAAPYAETILRCAGRPVPRSLCALTAVDELKGRLMMISRTHGTARKWTGLAIAAGLAAGGLLLAAPAAADDGKPGETKEFVKRIEIHQRKGDKDVLVRREGEEARVTAIMANCEGEKFETSSQGGTDTRKENVKFLVCTGKGESLLSSLEKALARIEQSNDIPADRKGEIVGQLRAKIAELRAKG